MLLELAHYHLHKWGRAQEVVQDTWMDFLKSLRRFEGRCSVKTWLVQILKRCIKKEQRRTIFKRTLEALAGIVKDGVVDGGTNVEHGGSLREYPERALLIRERLEHILPAGRRLPQGQAEIWILRDLFQWTSEEVSASLGITTENQRVLLHRARQRLQAEMRRYFGERQHQPSLVALNLMTCRDLEGLTTEYLEGALSPPARVDFEAHVAACAKTDILREA